MGVKLRVSRDARLVRFFLHPAGKVILALCLLGGTAGFAIFTYYYIKFARLIDARLRSGPYPTAAMIFAAPRVVSLGDEITPEEIAELLRRSGYDESKTNPMGWFRLRPGAIEIFPGPDSYFDQEGGVIRFENNRVVEIISTRDHTARTQYMLEPELLTNLYQRVGDRREKRRPVKFSDLPPVLVQAVLAAEDKRFFMHAGFDPIRVVKAAYVDLRKGRLAEGASTLTMQLAGTVWLNRRERTWRRKAAEVLITLHLERKLTKEQIFEHYANHIDLGMRGSFAIRGFGEAARAYFGKDVRDLTLPEAAVLAGLIRQPSFTNPVRWPERARARRNLVLKLMLENGYITREQYEEAVAAPLKVVQSEAESTDAPYFVDLVNNQLQDNFQDYDFEHQSHRVYTTLDIELQRDAAEAVRLGLKEIDELLKRRRDLREKPTEVQVALVALDARTGELRALIGGRDYGRSQLNRALARRQPGSAFKPFVYAAALSTAIEGGGQIITPVTTLLDEPTTFYYDGKPYAPDNFGEKYYGPVSVRYALTHSLNVPTVKLAEMVGYEKVVEVARRAGMNLRIQPTPSVALGAYEVTPLEIAGAYTIFPNMGTYVEPYWIKLIRDDKGKVVYVHQPKRREALDPRVAYLMIDLMREVLRSGTGAGVRARGFVLPAAGKTGTSHDGWFAGFTSKLICVVWVGFDDNRELGLEGARSALPIWAEFMKRAHRHREYRNVTDFDPPEGIVMVDICPASGGLATTACPSSQIQAFIAGTQPLDSCRLHAGRLASTTHVSGWETAAEWAEAQAGAEAKASTSEAREARQVSRTPSRPKPSATKAEAPPAQPAPNKSFFRRILDVFK